MPYTMNFPPFRTTLPLKRHFNASLTLLAILFTFFGVDFVTALRGGALQQQYFRVKPKDVLAPVGSNVTMVCEVENQSGKVQWTKDGFALGFQTIIPGHPRYRMLMDEDRGVFNLFIMNLSLEDDAEFQCQVSPAVTPIIHKLIRSSANLTVLSPPTDVQITGQENNSKLEVRENHEIRLQCRARRSKPPPRIVWYRGNTELKFDNQEDNVTVSESTIESKVKLYDVISEIRLKPSVEDDGVNYTCEAIHDVMSTGSSMAAIGILKKQRPKATILLSVLYPPGLPYIEGYNEGDILRQGQKVELICRSRGGNPPAQLVWYKNGEQVGAVYRTVGRLSENVYLFTADMTDNKARFICEASSVINRTRLTTEVNLTVHYPPNYVSINGSLEARVGDTVPLNCSTGPSNPAAQIRWLIDGKPVDNATSRTMVTADNGWLTYSNVSLYVEPNKTAVVVICYGINTYINENKVATHTINILYPPNRPIIQRKTIDSYSVAGSVEQLTCTSSGGNPLATLTWYRNDREVSGAVIRRINKTISSELTVLVNASDNEAIYKCEANNSALDIPLFQTEKLNIYFPPSNAIIRVEPEELQADTAVKLTCDVSSSNPEAELSWWVEGLPVTDGIRKTSKAGLHGGKVSSIELNLNLTSDMNGKMYTCQAVNSILQRSIDKSIVLKIMYKPIFVELNETTFTGIEGESLVINLKAVSHPPISVYTWTKENAPFPSTSRVYYSGSVLNITRLSRFDSGLYMCEALNSIGTATLKFQILVQYPATIVHASNVTMVNEGDNAELECTVDGYPLGTEHVMWKRGGGFPMEARTSFQFHNATSVLVVLNVTKEDMGSFQCVVDNGIGNETSVPAFLVVKHKPEMDLSDNLLKSASHIGKTAKLYCVASGAPTVTFSWSRSGTILPINSSNKYITYHNQVTIIKYMSTLLINNLVAQDYGVYGCTARNALGFSTTAVKLQSVSAPDPPNKLTMVNATHDSITFVWNPGFDGGQMAFYRVRYHATDTGKTVYKFEDVGNVTVHTVYGLMLATCYNFNVMAYNNAGLGTYSQDTLKACSLSEGPPSLPSRGEVSDDENKIPFAIGVGSVLVLILLNVSLVVFCILRRSKAKYRDNGQDVRNNNGNKNGSVEMYSSNSNMAASVENVNSISEKSDHYGGKSFNQEDGRTSAVNTYLIEEIDYPFQEPSAYEIEVSSEKMKSYHRNGSVICRNGSLCQLSEPSCQTLSVSHHDGQFIAYPPPMQFAHPPLQYLPTHRGGGTVPPPDVTVQTVPLSTFNYGTIEHDGHLV